MRYFVIYYYNINEDEYNYFGITNAYIKKTQDNCATI